jgi:protein O-mannosyl-transferase
MSRDEMDSSFLFRAIMMVAVGFWIYAPSLTGSWLMDDNFYLPQNALLHDPHRLWKTWFEPGSLIEYYPIEATVQAVQWRLWHLNMVGYHLTNVVLHLTSAFLFWRLLQKFKLRLAWLGGLLLVIHPTAVESVAWISELKNTLSLPPFLLAMICWINHDERHSSRDYLLALVFFFLAMLCKISMALFPFVILLYAWWKRGRVDWHDLKMSTPFFAISLVLGTTTILAGDWYREAHLQLAVNPEIGAWPERFVLSGTSVLF